MNTGNQRRDVLGMLAALGLAAGEPVFAPAQAQAQGGSDLAGGKIVFENDKVRVISHYARPRLGVCGMGLHSHPPHLTVCLTDTKAKVMLPGKAPFILETKAGDAFWDTGGPHSVENVGSRDTKVYLVEIKST
ncbi:MAG TPA: hypothetical protein VII68_00405 [Casimicrobiaceae bacterium]|jgi:hypothetical protein